MFPMQQHTRPSTTDELFGQAVARLRNLRGLSQREFAAALAAEGMLVDASAISRIEKGTRSVRLAEAVTIASVLQVGVETLVRTQANPSAVLRELRTKVDSAFRTLGDSVWGTLIALWEVMDHLEHHPDLLQGLAPEDASLPTSVAEYVRWVRGRLSEWPVSEEELTVFRDEEVGEVVELMTYFVRMYVGRMGTAGDWSPLEDLSRSRINQEPA